jgi:hypothetical protein
VFIINISTASQDIAPPTPPTTTCSASSVISTETFLIKGVSPSVALLKLKDQSAFADWACGGINSDRKKTSNVTTKTPFNLKAARAFMVQARNGVLGTVMNVFSIF